MRIIIGFEASEIIEDAPRRIATVRVRTKQYESLRTVPGIGECQCALARRREGAQVNDTNEVKYLVPYRHGYVADRYTSGVCVFVEVRRHCDWLLL
jgi:hypothetical protein